MKNLIIAFGLLLVPAFIFPQTNSAEAKLKKFDTEIKDLINRLTLEEKISQFNAFEPNPIPRLGIPLFRWHNEALRGVMGDSATVFPQSINIASTFNDSLMAEMATAISDEARILYKRGEIGISFWSPNLNLMRDPRWGRNQETYGEDPFLISRMGSTFTRYMRGDDPLYLKTITSAKHFVVHSGPEETRLKYNAIVSEYYMWDTYMRAFRSAVIDGNTYSLMTAFNAINGRAISADKHLLTDIVRKKWGLEGHYVSDCSSIGAMIWGLKYYYPEYKGVAAALNAGFDIECGYFIEGHLGAAIENKALDISVLDSSLYRLFMARYRTGEFSPKSEVKYNFIPDSLLLSEKHIKLSEEIATQSIVLLKNENETLPIQPGSKKILLIGPHTEGFYYHIGNYSGWPTIYTTIQDGIKQRSPVDIQIDQMRGIDIIGAATYSPGFPQVKGPNGENGWVGEYYNNVDLEGKPALVRLDSAIDFDWVFESPHPKIVNDNFSVRWTGKIIADTTALMTLKTISDEGVRLYVNDSLVFELWEEIYAVPQLVFYQFEKGNEYKIVLEYFEKKWWASCNFQLGHDNDGDDYFNFLSDKASEYDAVIFAGGLSHELENEQWDQFIPGYNWGDRLTLDLPLIQQKALKALHKSGKPVIALIASGAAMALNWESENLAAILQISYCGQEVGKAVANVLFGDYNPAGRLPYTSYKSVDDLPDFDEYSMDNRTYRYFEGEPLFPFGYGLSYTDFEYSNLSIPGESFEVCDTDSIPVRLTVANTGKYDGDEVVQIYISKDSSKYKWPIKELKGFKRAMVKKGQSREFEIKIGLHGLNRYDTVFKEYVVEPGEYKIMAGASSADIRLQGAFTLTNCGHDTLSVNTDSPDTYSPDFGAPGAGSYTSPSNINGIDEFRGNVYPNPATEILNIESPDTIIHAANVEIIDIYGRKSLIPVAQGGNDKLLRIRVSGLSKGVYFMYLHTVNGIQAVKFVKM